MTAPARLAIRHLSKTFGVAKVLDEVDFTVGAGEVHGLAGQNGSGKSTLIKIITGVYTPDAGAELELDGTQVRLPVRWSDVHAAGVSVVHQDLGLLEELTVADNICVGGFPHQRLTRRIDRGQQLELARRALDRVGADIDPTRLASTLSAPERAEVAVARALRDHRPASGLVIMDESTRSLTGSDLVRVHGILRALAADGTSVVLISHSLPELLTVTDKVTILRDGLVVGAGMSTAELTEQAVARRMLGSAALGSDVALDKPTPAHRAGAPSEPLIAVSGLTGRRVGEVSFTVNAGEIVGITGLPGSGYEDIPYLLTGAMPAQDGQLRAGASHLDLPRTSITKCLRAGVMLVPEQRVKHGLALELSVRDNLVLPNLRRRGRGWFLGRAWQQRDADAAVKTFGIRPQDTDRLVKTLSGGNQQKVLLAKWLSALPSLLVLHEPTQAVDVGARRDILLAIRQAADDGVAVLLVTAETSDLCAVCDRVYLSELAGGLAEVDARSSEDLLDRIYSQPPADAKAG